MTDSLVDKNVWVKLQQGCGRRICYPCKSSKGQGISCRMDSINYQITCRICEKKKLRIIYHGESSRSACERISEHMHLFKAKTEGDPEKNQSNSVLWQHSKDQHEGLMRTWGWEVKIVSSHRSSLQRQVTEAFHISQENPS